jgi:hypothetical protein
MASWKGFGRGLMNFGRNIPVVGELLPDEKIDQNSINTGQQFYSAPAQNAADLYTQAMQGTNASYQAGNIRDVDQGNALQGRQVTNLDALQAQANTAPEQQAAARQYAAMVGQQRNAAMGVAAGSRGAGRGAARLNVASQLGANAGINAQQGAALGMQERAQNLAAYTQAMQGVRGQDQQQAQLGVQRDVAADTAGRAAFDSTHGARQGYMGAAGTAVGQQANVAQGQAQTAQAQYELARAEEDRRRRAHAANRAAITETASKAYTAYKGG